MNVWYNFAPMNEAQKYLLQDLSVAIVDDHALILEGFKSLMQGCNAKNVETFGYTVAPRRGKDNSQHHT